MAKETEEEVITCLSCKSELSGDDLVLSLNDGEDIFCSDECLMEYLEDFHDLKKQTAEEYLEEYY